MKTLLSLRKPVIFVVLVVVLGILSMVLFLIPSGPTVERTFTVNGSQRPLTELTNPSGAYAPSAADLLEASLAPAVAVNAPSANDAASGAGEAASALPTALAPSSDKSGAKRIIKDGNLEITVDDLGLAMGRIGDDATQVGGYIIETTREQGGAPLATIKVAVPEARFETSMAAVRKLARRVLSDVVVGKDVSQEFVDLESELANLEVTRGRLRGLMDNAKSIEEALHVNAELARIENEIGLKKGRLQYLAQRTAYSTITVAIFRERGHETPLPFPTSTPLPPLRPWHPNETVAVSTRTLQEYLRQVVDWGIGFIIVWLPMLAILGAVSWPLAKARAWLVARRGPGTEPVASAE